MLNKLTTYISETREEMKRVSWPTSREAIAATVLVVVISAAIAAYLGFFDWLFSLGLQHIF